MFGLTLNCLLVKFVSSMAVNNPIIVTSRALNLREVGMVMMGVLVGRKFDVIISPAMILPHASRLIGFITDGSFSLIGASVIDRGCPIDAKKITRKLYTAVNEVAIRVRASAQAFRYDVFIASIIASFEKNPAKNGVPVRARLPIVMHEDVNGRVLCSPPIFRISCSSFRLWIIDPEHKNSMALKNAWVQMCRNASCG